MKLGIMKLPATYQAIYDESACLIMPEAEKLMMIADEMIAADDNRVVLTNDKVCIEIRRID